MNLYPQQTVQLKSEYDSLAILGYKLKDLGILRNVSINDFGIDLEIDIVEKSNVTGRILKAQIKSSRVAKKIDGDVSVGNIKQSTLRYWMSLSLRCPVIVFMVDLTTEEIYYSEPIETQAAALIDGTAAEKTVRLQHQLVQNPQSTDAISGLFSLLGGKVTEQDKANVRASLLATSKEIREANNNFETKHAYLAHLAASGSLADTKYMHLKCIENISIIFSFNNENTNFNMDHATGIFEPQFFRFFLKVAEKFIGYYAIKDYCRENDLDLAAFYREEYWRVRSEKILGFDPKEITYEGMSGHIPYLAKLLLEHLVIRRKQILEQEFIYWFEEDPHYIEAVYLTDIGENASGYYFAPHMIGFNQFRNDASAKKKKIILAYDEKSKKKAAKKTAAATTTGAVENSVADESSSDDEGES